MLCHACLNKLLCSSDRAGDTTAVFPIRRAELARAEPKLFFCYKTCAMKVFDYRVLEVLTAPMRPNEQEPRCNGQCAGPDGLRECLVGSEAWKSNSPESNLSAGLRFHSVA